MGDISFMTERAHPQPLATEFRLMHAHLIAMRADIAPIDITHHYSQGSYHDGRTTVGATLEPPTIWKEELDFKPVERSGAVATDKRRTTISLIQGEVVVESLSEQQDRTPAPDKTLPRRWTGNVQPDLTDKQRERVFTSLASIIHRLYLRDTD